ncbi:LytTR family DNA-binding domain-containing protein [Maribacter sp.]|nr:LytTR family DNA-binding domain-containing protein [Maribacter sp.]
MKTRCLIVDDEPLAIEVIESYLEQFENFEIIDRCNNAIRALKVIEEEAIDLLFLDIQMPKISGIDFLRSLKNPPKVIFTTAHIDYAIESYEFDVIDYLVKPIPFDRFFKGINKYKNQVKSATSLPEVHKPNPIQNHIYVRADKKNNRVVFDEILYVDSIKDYIRIHLPAKSLLVKTTLTNFEKLLPQNQFIRVHRSYLVNSHVISAHTYNDIEIGAIEIPIGTSYKQKTFDFLK